MPLTHASGSKSEAYYLPQQGERIIRVLEPATIISQGTSRGHNLNHSSGRSRTPHLGLCYRPSEGKKVHQAR